MTIDTAKAKRRPVRYASLDELLADAERIAAADRAGKLTRTGNWTAGQSFGHLAGWTDAAYDGYPSDMPKPPWIFKVLLKMMKNRFLHKGMPVGMKIRGVEGGTKFIDPLPLDEGLARLRRTIARVRTTQPIHGNPIFGTMKREECELALLRHAEIHLSFLHP
jgi:hypothetical protein